MISRAVVMSAPDTLSARMSGATALVSRSSPIAKAAEGRTLSSGSSSSGSNSGSPCGSPMRPMASAVRDRTTVSGERDPAAEHRIIPLPGILGGEHRCQRLDAGIVLRLHTRRDEERQEDRDG